MSNEVVSCNPGDDISDVEEVMAERQKSRILCITEDGTLAGVISLSDVVQWDDDGQVLEMFRQVSLREAKF